MRSAAARRALRRNLWTIGLVALLAAVFVFTKLIQPSYGATGIQGLAVSVAALAFAAVAQAIVVMSGGIDLSIGAMMALTNVVAAVAMRGQSEEAGLAIAVGVLVLGVLLGTINGMLVVFTRVADIIVTLAMSFVWAGCALLVLKVPGGQASHWLTDLAKGSLGTEWLPKPAVVVLLVVAVTWIPLRRSRLGLSLYAIGSDRLAAFRSGVSVGRTKIASYALAGLFSALGGLAITANTGIGTPTARWLHADQRRRRGPRRRQPGRRSRRRVRTDRRGRHPGPHPGRHDLPQPQLEPRDRDPGRHPHRGRHVRQLHRDAAGAGVTGAQATMGGRSGQGAGGLMRTLRERPVLPLLGLLAILMIAFVLLNPRANVADWFGATLRAAVPLAILAGCQTIVMLTGGIDLSVAATASMAAFVTASLLDSLGLPAAIAVSLLIAVLVGVINGIGIGVFRVHPLIMTLGMGLVVFGASNAWQLLTVRTSSGVPPEIRWIGSTTVVGLLPASLLVFVPIAAVIMLGLRRTGYGRLLFAIGDNPIAARLSGARSWQVLVVLYVISALLAAIAGFLISGFSNVASVTLGDTYLLPSVAAAVIGGTSIFGGRGGYGGTIVGALILTVATSLLFSLGFPEAVRQILFGLIIVLVAAGYARVTGET